MSWNFCPWCSHRIYQHNGEGCIHVEHSYGPCRQGAECPDHNPDSHGHGHYYDDPCDCKRPHQLMVEAIGG